MWCWPTCTSNNNVNRGKTRQGLTYSRLPGASKNPIIISPSPAKATPTVTPITELPLLQEDKMSVTCNDANYAKLKASYDRLMIDRNTLHKERIAFRNKEIEANKQLVAQEKEFKHRIQQLEGAITLQ
jgi:hypothetical protein